MSERIDYMHEMLTECPHSPLCHDSWDPCLLALQQPHRPNEDEQFQEHELKSILNVPDHMRADQ